MRHLLENRFAPVTFTIGFLEADITRVSAFLESWRDSINRRQRVKCVSASLADMLKALAPVTYPETKELLVVTDSTWTAYFVNSSRVPNIAGVMSHVSSNLHVRGVLVSYVPGTVDATGVTRLHASVHMELFSPTNTDFLNYERSIGVFSEDGRWQFIASGRTQAFERPDEYTKRLVKDRFTPALLAEYSKSLGIEGFSSDFYGREGILIEEEQPFATEALSYAEAQRALGLTEQLS